MELLKQCRQWFEQDEAQKVIDTLEAIPAGERTPELDSELAKAERVADAHVVLRDDFAVLVEEHRAYLGIVETGPAHLLHAVYIYGIDIHVGVVGERIGATGHNIGSDYCGQFFDEDLREFLADAAQCAVGIESAG